LSTISTMIDGEGQRRDAARCRDAPGVRAAVAALGDGLAGRLLRRDDDGQQQRDGDEPQGVRRAHPQLAHRPLVPDVAEPDHRRARAAR
jgi:hypothetical protein